MTTRCRPHRFAAAAPGLDRGHLAVLLDGLLSACAPPLDPADADLPVAVGVSGLDPATAEIHLWGLQAPDPVRQLYGLSAPADWSAFGVVASGRVRSVQTSASGRLVAGPVATPGGRRPCDTEPKVSIALLVSRQGDQLTASREAAGEVTPATFQPPGGTGPGPTGRIPDACHRVLGLATAPPEAPVLELWAARWLERVLASTLAEPRAWSWAEVVAAYPTCGRGPSHAGTDAATTTLRLMEAAESASMWSWDDLRRVQARGTVAAFGIEPGEAAWMDEGMFSREVLGGLPLVEQLVVDLSDLLAPRVTGQIRRALQAWGLA